MAVSIAEALNQVGSLLDLSLIRAATLAHDLARGKRKHDRYGADILRALDMPQIGAIVETHMELPGGGINSIREAEVVFLADKLIREDRFVGLTERFRCRLDDNGADPATRDFARRRLETARRRADRVEAIIGCPLESLWESTHAV